MSTTVLTKTRRFVFSNERACKRLKLVTEKEDDGGYQTVSKVALNPYTSTTASPTNAENDVRNNYIPQNAEEEERRTHPGARHFVEYLMEIMHVSTPTEIHSLMMQQHRSEHVPSEALINKWVTEKHNDNKRACSEIGDSSEHDDSWEGKERYSACSIRIPSTETKHKMTSSNIPRADDSATTTNNTIDESFSQPKYAHAPTLYDVVVVEGSDFEHHPGNLAFRRMILEKKCEYDRIGGDDVACKRKVATDIVNTIETSGGRFLHSLTKEQAAQLIFNKSRTTYAVVDNGVAIEATLQALQEEPEQQHAKGQHDTQGQHVPPSGEQLAMTQQLATSVVPQSESQSRYVNGPTNWDVVVMGTPSDEHYPGNLVFRRMVQTRKTRYDIVTMRVSKRSVAHEIVKTVHMAHGRFLRPLSNEQMAQQRLDTSRRTFEVMNFELSMDMTEQALREAPPETSPQSLAGHYIMSPAQGHRMVGPAMNGPVVMNRPPASLQHAPFDLVVAAMREQSKKQRIQPSWGQWGVTHHPPTNINNPILFYLAAAAAAAAAVRE